MIRSFTLLSLVALPLAAGCVIFIGKDGPPPEPWPDSGGIACDTMAVSSVLVRVEDEAGAPISANQVSWQAEGMDEDQPAECAGASCTTWLAGYEVDGDIRVEAAALLDSDEPGCYWEGHASGSVTVPMTADGCHVITQELTLVMASADFRLLCDDDTATTSGATGG